MQAAAAAALEYAFPLTEVMRICDLYPAVNWLNRGQRLNTPQDTKVVRPNNDTLYANACAYLGASWVQITIPAPRGRYQSVQVFDAYTTTAALIGPNQLPSAGGTYVLHLRGSGTADLPAGIPVIEVATPFAFVLFRTLVNGPADLADAIAAQAGIDLKANSAVQPERPSLAGSGSAARDLFTKIMLRLAQNPPPASEASFVASFAAAGIRPSLTPLAEAPTAPQLAAWEAAYTSGLDKITAAARAVSSPRGTWTFPDPKLATPGTAYALRAFTAKFGLFALPPSESIYPSTGGDGTAPHVLRLPRGWAPIGPRGFWSLTMYDDNGFLVDNRIQRYSISDRTPGVKFDRDGSLKVYIQCKDPGGARTANWLPAPCGPFSLSMRLYMPTAAALDPSFTLPPLTDR
jgi:hypothetical protein